MRIILFALFAALLTSPNGRADQTSDTDGLACFENLAAPEYPREALQTHVEGSVWTWTHVNAQGVPEKIDTQVVSAWSEGPKLLTPAVEKTIRAARIKPECKGKTVWVVFSYRLQGDASSEPKISSHPDGSNVMRIEGQPAAATNAGGQVSARR
jgi:hypothetical protein